MPYRLACLRRPAAFAPLLPALFWGGAAGAADGDADQIVRSSFVNTGDYLKTGPHTLSYELEEVVGNYWNAGRFDNSGRLTVQQGLLKIRGGANSRALNTGTLTVDGGAFDIALFRGEAMDWRGRIEVRRGSMDVSQQESRFSSSADWRIGAGARLHFGSGSADYGGTSTFSGGSLRNEGILQFSGPAQIARGRLGGPGELQALPTARLRIDGPLDIGTLHLAPTAAEPGVGPFSARVEIGGALALDRLDWRGGSLSAAGPVTVRGLATLSGFAPFLDRTELHAKFLDGRYRFEGGVDWAGDADLLGGASLRIAPGTTFRDRTPLDLDWPGGSGPGPRPALLQVFEFDNAGTYLKTGAGRTQVEAVFRNTGTVRALDAAPLVFQGPLDNRGSVEAVRSRIELRGPLAQWGYEDATLGGGRWVMRDGVIVLQPAGLAVEATVRHNAATLVLDGPGARLEGRSRGGGQPVDALQTLRGNSGRLELLGGATLQLGLLDNRGTLVIGAGSTLTSSGYTQSGVDGATWVAGTLRGMALLQEGRFGAGLEGGTGHAELDAALFGDGLLLLADIAPAGRFDTLHAGGSLGLDGRLHAEFAPDAAGPGRWRLLSSDAGLSGRFDRLTSNLDPALYRLGAVYGADFMELTVSPVPEPGTWALTALGLAGLATGTRRRAGARP